MPTSTGGNLSWLEVRSKLPSSWGPALVLSMCPQTSRGAERRQVHWRCSPPREGPIPGDHSHWGGDISRGGTAGPCWQPALPQVKKLVYVYLVRYAEEQQDLALLSISTFQRGLKVSGLSVPPWAQGLVGAVWEV